MLLDDELPGLTYLKMLCEQIPNLEVVKAYNNPLVLLEEMHAIDFDLCILDIEMPEMSGIQVANLLHGKAVIFTTAYKEYAAEAFDLFAVDYVRKPVQLDRLKVAIQKANKFKETETKAIKYVQLNTDKGKSIVFFDQILCIRTSDGDSRDKELRLADGSELKLKNISFEKLKNLLPASDFCQINKKELISLSSVKHFSNDEITVNWKNSSDRFVVLNLGAIFRSDFIQKLL